MPRARNIKPSLFTNELLGTDDPMVTLTFVGLWCLADKEGKMEERPLRIKAELFPYRDNVDINGYLTVLERKGFIDRYVVDGMAYIQVVNFLKHQSPHHTEKPKGYPDKPLNLNDTCDVTVKSPLDNDRFTVPTRSDSLIPDSLIHKNIEQKKTARINYSDTFESFWKNYPRNEGKAPAYAIWQKLKLDDMLAEIVAGLQWSISHNGWDKDAKFCPHAQNWLKARRWEDAPKEKPKAVLQNADEIVTFEGQEMTRAQMQAIKHKRYEERTGYAR